MFQERTETVALSAFIASFVLGELLKLVALYEASSDELDFTCSLCTGIKWNNDNSVPIAAAEVQERIETVALSAFIAGFVTAMSGIALATGFLIFNYKYRTHK